LSQASGKAAISATRDEAAEGMTHLDLTPSSTHASLRNNSSQNPNTAFPGKPLAADSGRSIG
jgi:hypothetical protein